MLEIKLPCEIGTRIRDKENNIEGRIVGYHITTLRSFAEVITNLGESVLFSSKDGIFLGEVEILDGGRT